MHVKSYVQDEDGKNDRSSSVVGDRKSPARKNKFSSYPPASFTLLHTFVFPIFCSYLFTTLCSYVHALFCLMLGVKDCDNWIGPTY